VTSGHGLLTRSRRTLDLVRMLAPREVRIRYRQSVLDITWALINPVVVAAVYGYILTRSFSVTGGCAPYVSSAWTGLVLWTYFSTAVGTAVASMISSSDLITKMYFPREAVPLSMAGASLVDLGVGLVTVFAVLLVQGVPLRITMLAAALPIAMLIVWTAALCVLFAALAPFARDLIHAVNLGLRVGFFATPVMYDAKFLPAAVEWSVKANPVAVAIDQTRSSLLCGQWPVVVPLVEHSAIGFALLVGGVLYTRAVESRLADVV
jgi:lipopolysaccharide transport system permease protein